MTLTQEEIERRESIKPHKFFDGLHALQFMHYIHYKQRKRIEKREKRLLRVVPKGRKE